MAEHALGDGEPLSQDNADEVADRAAEIRRAVEERASAAREWAADQGDVLRDTVQTKPFISIGVSAASAFVAGLAIGLLLARR